MQARIPCNGGDRLKKGKASDTVKGERGSAKKRLRPTRRAGKQLSRGIIMGRAEKTQVDWRENNGEGCSGRSKKS